MDIQSKALRRLLAATLMGVAGTAVVLLFLSQSVWAEGKPDAGWFSPSLNSGDTRVTQAGTPVSVTLLPAAATVTAGLDISYTLIMTDDQGTGSDVTISGTYTITLDAGGVWDVNVYTAEMADVWIVEGNYDGLTDTAVLTVTHAGVADIDLAPSTAVVTAGQSRTYTVTAIDAFNNSWDVTGDSSFAVTPGAGGSWIDNTYTSQVAGTWTVTGTYAGVDDTAALTVSPAELDYIALSPSASTIFAWQAQAYTVEAFDTYNNSRGDVTAQSSFSILESGHGGEWMDNVYTPENHGDWTVRADYAGEVDNAALTVLGPFLHLDKNGTLDVVDAGAFLTYTISCSNTGNLTATNVFITDTLDPYVSFDGASMTPYGGLPNAPYWSIGEIPPGESRWLTVTVAVARPLTDGTTLVNVAWLDANWLGAGRTDPLSDTEETTVQSQPVLSFSKTEYPDPVRAGGTLRYTLVMTNTGNENATSVVVHEQYDPNVSFFSSNPSPDSGNDTWTFSVLEPDQPTSIDVFVEVADMLPVGTVLTNRATLDSDQTGPLNVSETTAVTSSSELLVYKLDSPIDDVQAGAELVYVINYQASGTAPAESVVITEVYDSRFSFLSANPPPEAGTDNVWQIGNLDVNESGSILVTGRVDTPLPNGTVLTNWAMIDSVYTSPQICSETTRVASAPDFAFTVIGRPDPVEPGTPLSYTLGYTNTGNADATQVVITATLDAHLFDVSALPAPTGKAGNVWYWEVGTVAGADDVGGFGYGQIVIHTKVTTPLTNGLPLNFAAQLGDAEGDLEEVIEDTIVTSGPALSFQKSDGVTSVEAGDLLTYVFDYTNAGTENAYEVVVTDTLPDCVSYVGCEIDGGNCQPLPPDEPDRVIFHISAITQSTGHSRLRVRVKDPLPAGIVSLINVARMAHPSLTTPVDEEDRDSIVTRPDLVVEVEHEPYLFAPGKRMTYIASYSNTGSMHAEDVVLTTSLPTNTAYVGFDWQSSDGQTYVYQAGDVLAGASAQLVTFVVEYPADEPQQVDVTDFSTPFFIAENGGAGEDSTPDDNAVDVDIGVPDLIVVDFTITPKPLKPNVPSTVTVVIANQGTGWALNPDVYPGHAGSTVDVFLNQVSSYPFEGYSDKGIWDEFAALAPGAERTMIITLTKSVTGLVIGPILFSEEELLQEIQKFYVKVDSLGNNSYGLVPESNEMNNVRELDGFTDRLYLPIVLRR